MGFSSAYLGLLAGYEKSEGEKDLSGSELKCGDEKGGVGKRTRRNR